MYSVYLTSRILKRYRFSRYTFCMVKYNTHDVLLILFKMLFYFYNPLTLNYKLKNNFDIVL